jgi:hypothetical protein
MEDEDIPQRGVRCFMIKALCYRGPVIQPTLCLSQRVLQFVL